MTKNQYPPNSGTKRLVTLAHLLPSLPPPPLFIDEINPIFSNSLKKKLKWEQLIGVMKPHVDETTYYHPNNGIVMQTNILTHIIFLGMSSMISSMA